MPSAVYVNENSLLLPLAVDIGRRYREKAGVDGKDSFPSEMRLKIHFNASLMVMDW